MYETILIILNSLPGTALAIALMRILDINDTITILCIVYGFASLSIAIMRR